MDDAKTILELALAAGATLGAFVAAARSGRLQRRVERELEPALVDPAPGSHATVYDMLRVLEGGQRDAADRLKVIDRRLERGEEDFDEIRREIADLEEHRRRIDRRVRNLARAARIPERRDDRPEDELATAGDTPPPNTIRAPGA